MTITPKFHWLIRLRNPNSGRKGRVLHLALSDEHGDAMCSTICGKQYDSADRIEASKGLEAITGRECVGCLRRLSDAFTNLRELFIEVGKPEQEAVALADEILKLRRDSK